MLGIVYLLHFERPISMAHTCQHYLGWCLDLTARLAVHRAGNGARLTQIAVERGIGFEVVRTWEGTRELERYLKDGKRGPRLCPLCRQMQGLRAQPARPGVEQLELPLDTLPEVPALPIGRGEIYITQQWRAARAVGTIDLAAIDDLL